KVWNQVDERYVGAHFPASTGKKPSNVVENRGIGSSVSLTASNGTEFETQNAYCSEGENTQHALSMKGAAIPNHVEPCTSISAVEVVGNQLWLGTRLDGEYGDYPAQGLVVQTMKDGKLLKKLDANG